MATSDVVNSGAMPRSLTTGAFLTHDMSPKDPYADYARSQSMYDPSRGPPVRDFRLRGYTSHQMLEEHKKAPILPLGNSPSPRAAGKSTADPVTKIVNPGRADTSAEFFEGKHTTAHTRTNIFGGIDDRFTPADIAKLEKQRTQQHQDELRRYIDEVKRSKTEQIISQDQEKRKDLDMLRTYDPWGKGAGSPSKNKALVSKDRQDRVAAEAASDTYVAQAFGKQGAGAPVRTDSGKVKAAYTLDGDTQMGNVYRSNFGVDAGRRYGSKEGANDYKAALDAQAQERARITAEQTAQAKQPVEDSPFTRGSQNPPPRVKQPKEDPDRERRAHYAKSLEQQQKEQRARKEQETAVAKSKGDDYAPWGRGVGVPERDASGKVVKKAAASPVAKEPTMADFLGKPGAGAPITEGSGRLSPTKPVIPTDVYDPFGKPGAGAPGSDPRRHRSLDTSPPPPAGTYAARHEFLREQQALIEAKQQQDKAARAERDSPHKPDDFFKFGQGAANPKRDEHGMLQSQHRGQTDIISMQLDTGGGLGRKQKTEASQSLHQQLERQASEKRQLEAQARQAQIAEEQKHMSQASSWQGKAGAGAPRRAENGEVHGRYALDKEMHYDELIDTPKVVAKEERKKYADDLSKFSQQKAQQAQQEFALSREKSHLHASTVSTTFGKQGNGAPLRSSSGKVVAQPARLRDPTDVEWKLGARPGHIME